MLAAVVCEGPTDFVVLKELLYRICSKLDDVIPLQPEGDETSFEAGGWLLVKKWCQDNGPKLSSFLGHRYGDPIDILLIHVDGDIAASLGIDVQGRAAKEIAQDVCKTVKSWLGHPPRLLPPQVIITIPMESTETWIVAGLEGGSILNLERLPHPAGRLVSAGKLLADANGRPVKDLARYREMARSLGLSTTQLFRKAPEADRLRGKLSAKC